MATVRTWWGRIGGVGAFKEQRKLGFPNLWWRRVGGGLFLLQSTKIEESPISGWPSIFFKEKNGSHTCYWALQAYRLLVKWPLRSDMDFSNLEVVCPIQLVWMLQLLRAWGPQVERLSIWLWHYGTELLLIGMKPFWFELTILFFLA